MRSTSNQLPIWSIKGRKSKIDPKPAYQRGAVWSLERKQLLIDSILRGYDIPKIYLRVLPQGQEFEYEVVDGQQRLRAIWEFLDNTFPLGRDSIDFDDMEDLAGKTYAELNSEQQDKIGAFNLTITNLENADEIEVRELFLRLQEGASLTPPEKRNAMIGNMRDFVQELSQHPIFLKTTVRNDRFQYADYAAHVTAVELQGGPTDVKAADLKRMYEVDKDFDFDGVKAKKIKKVLNYLDRVFDDACNELKIKWGFVDLYWLVSRCLERYDVSTRQKDFYSFYLGFELERNQVSDPSDLITAGHTAGQRDLYDYIVAFQREGAIRSNLSVRADVYMRKFLEDFPDIVAKDSRRSFDETERLVIWRRAFMKCQRCGVGIKLQEMHADHVTPHSRGGLTTIENAQALCVKCNLSKGNNL